MFALHTDVQTTHSHSKRGKVLQVLQTQTHKKPSPPFSVLYIWNTLLTRRDTAVATPSLNPKPNMVSAQDGLIEEEGPGISWHVPFIEVKHQQENFIMSFEKKKTGFTKHFYNVKNPTASRIVNTNPQNTAAQQTAGAVILFVLTEFKRNEGHLSASVQVGGSIICR